MSFISNIKKVGLRLISIIKALNNIDRTQSIQRGIYYGMLFNQVTVNSAWLIDRSFAPGRWAVDYCFLYVMYRSLDAFRPKHILDVGLGQTTRMFVQYFKWMKDKQQVATNLVSIEHDGDWIAFFRKQYNIDCQIKQFELDDNGTYHLPNGKDATGLYMYKGFEDWVKTEDKFDFVSVDAPYGNKPMSHSRVQLLDLVKYNKLADEFVVMIDDAHRSGESRTIDAFCNELDNKGINYCIRRYKGEKTHCLITTSKYRFLTTL